MRSIPMRAATVLVLLLTAALTAAGPKQPRLIVDNRTGSSATVQVWRYTGDHWDWTTVATVAPRTWVPVYSVKANDRFRAVAGGGGTFTHTVSLYEDKAYSGPQDIWLLR
jgi:hypothetical protein